MPVIFGIYFPMLTSTQSNKFIVVKLSLQPDADAVIQIHDGSTHIINHGSDELRIKIRDALLSSLLQV